MITTQIPVLNLSPEVDELWDELNIAFQRVLRSTAFIMGPDVRQFEEEVAAYLGTKHAIGVNSGTDALVIGLKAAGVGPGDEVITTPFSFFATAESISIVGAKPVFADIEEESLNIDPLAIEAVLTPKTRAIVPVHLFGRPINMSRILEIADAHDLKVIEDCAQSFGAFDPAAGKITGTIGHVGAYSFFPSKNLGGFGDGGLLATDDEAIAQQARMLRVHGARKKYHNEILGYNSRLDTLQAAMLRVKLRHIDRFNAGRLRVAETYNSLLGDVPGIITPALVRGHVFHQYTVRVLNGNRDKMQEQLAIEGVSSMVYYPVPQDRLPVYAGQYPENPVSDRMSTEVLSLPIWPSMPEEDIQKIAITLAKIKI